MSFYNLLKLDGSSLLPFSTSALLEAFRDVPGSGTFRVPLVGKKRVGADTIPVLAVDRLTSQTSAQFRATVGGLLDGAEEVQARGTKLKLMKHIPLTATGGLWRLDAFHRHVVGDVEDEGFSNLGFGRRGGPNLYLRAWPDQQIGIQMEQEGPLAAIRQVVMMTPDGRVQTLGIFLTFYDEGIDWLKQYLELPVDAPLHEVLVAAAEHVYFSGQYTAKRDLGRMSIGGNDCEPKLLTTRTGKRHLSLPQNFTPPLKEIAVTSGKTVFDIMDPDDAEGVTNPVLNVYGELPTVGDTFRPYVAISMYRSPESDDDSMATAEDAEDLIDGARHLALMTREELRANLLGAED